MTPGEAAIENLASISMTRVSECEKRRALKVPWREIQEASSRKAFIERGGGLDKRLTLCDPTRSTETDKDARKLGDCKHAKQWESTHNIVESRVNTTSPMKVRSYFDRMLDVRTVGHTSLLPRALPVTWDLSDPTMTRERKLKEKLATIRKSGIPKRPEQFHGGDWRK